MNRPLFRTTLSILSYDIGKYVRLRTYQHPLIQTWGPYYWTCLHKICSYHPTDWLTNSLIHSLTHLLTPCYSFFPDLTYLSVYWYIT
jgi:hypothetical protein